MSANEATPSGDLPRKPRRRWLQLSLRTVLILVTLLSIGLGWFVHRGERQRLTVAALKKMGARIYYDAPGSSAMRCSAAGRSFLRGGQGATAMLAAVVRSWIGGPFLLRTRPCAGMGIGPDQSAAADRSPDVAPSVEHQSRKGHP